MIKYTLKTYFISTKEENSNLRVEISMIKWSKLAYLFNITSNGGLYIYILKSIPIAVWGGMVKQIGEM